MSERKHPLAENPNWIFTKPDVGFRAHYLAVGREKRDSKKTILTVETSDSCRETVISNLQAALRNRLAVRCGTVLEEQRLKGLGRRPTRDWTIVRDCDLKDPAGKKKHSELKIQWHSRWMRAGGVGFPSVEKFLQVCDRILGPVAVLLGPWRPEGNEWWRTDPGKALRLKGSQKYVHWRGSDNWFLAHPATVAIATGLYRQCFQLCSAGMADRIIADISEEEISEVMSTNSQKQALLILRKKTRPWIEVPAGVGGHETHYPFPLGSWSRLIRLQRAIRKYGYEESIGQSFHEGWDITYVELYPGGSICSGVHTLWGEEDELTEHHRHLMKIGAPGRKTRGKSAKKIT